MTKINSQSVFCLPPSTTLHILKYRLANFTRRTVEDTYSRVGWRITRDHSRLKDLPFPKLDLQVGAEDCETVSLS